MTLPLANRLADYACQLRFEDLPASVVHETKRRFIDSLATAVGAMDAAAYAIAKCCALHVQGQPGASLLGGGARGLVAFVSAASEDTLTSKSREHPDRHSRVSMPARGSE